MDQLHAGERIEASLAQFEPGAKLIRRWALHGGISARLTAFEVELGDASTQKFIAREPAEYGFRMNPDAAACELELLKALHQLGIPVQKPRFVEARTPQNPKPFYVMEFIDGSPEVDPTNVSDYLRKYVDQLVQIHRTELKTSKLPFLKSDFPAIPPIWGQVNDGLRETEIRAAFDLFGPYEQKNPSVFRHGDFWPGNVIWRDGHIAGVIDWEEARFGDPMADLSICRLDLLWVVGYDAMLEFTDLYQAQMNLDLTDLAYTDLCASLRPITNIDEWASSYPPLGRPNITTETMKLGHQQFVNQALRSI